MSLSSILNVFMIIDKVVPMILGFMKVAEESQKAGEVKKQAVTDMTKSTVSSMDEITTGGAQETWRAIEKPLTKSGGIIDLLATLFFGSKTVIPLDTDKTDYHAK